MSIRAVNPSHVIDDSIQKGHVDTETGLGLSEQLYTARGMQGMGIVHWITDDMVEDVDDYKQYMTFINTDCC